MGLFSNIFSKNKSTEPIQNLNSEVSGNDIIIAGEVIKDGEPPKEEPSVYYVLFANKISGFKGIPFDTRMLLVNDHPNNNLCVYYEFENEIKKETISRDKIQDVVLVSRIQMDNSNNNSDDTYKDDTLIKEAVFGGQPLSQFLKKVDDNKEEIGNKIDLSSYYELTITFVNEENENSRLIFKITTDCEKFVNFLKTNIGKK